jgi:uncharacterized protein (TIGR03067 family)
MQRCFVLISAVACLLVSGIHATSAEDAKDEALKKFKEALKGEWKMTSRIEDGVPSAAEVIEKRTIAFEGEKYTVRDGDDIFAEVIYRIDPAKKPAWLDITFIKPKDGAPDKGIIKVEGDTLTFCLAVGGARPDSFKSEKGDGRILAEYKRAKQ